MTRGAKTIEVTVCLVDQEGKKMFSRLTVHGN